MKNSVKMAVAFFLLVIGIVGTMLYFYFWKLTPRLSYDIVRVPMNELQDKEWFDVAEEVGDNNLVFSQRLETYCGAEDFLKLEVSIEGNTITITETYFGKNGGEVCPYDIYGIIEPLQEGTYFIRVIFVDKYLNKTEILHEITASFKVIPD